MNDGFLRNFYMVDLACKRSLKRAVEGKVREGKCLIDGCCLKTTKRGLCETHYQQFLNRKRKQDGKTEALAFEAECIREGLILAAGASREIKATDPFKSARAS